MRVQNVKLNEVSLYDERTLELMTTGMECQVYRCAMNTWSKDELAIED